jgi:hypothetical protein
MAMQRTALLTLIGVIGYVGSHGALSASAYRGGETRDAAHPFSEMRLAQAAITPVRARGEPAREPASSQATSGVRAAAAATEPASAQATLGVRAAAAAIEPASAPAASRVHAATAAREPASLETTSHSSMANSAISKEKIQAAARGKGRSRQ